MRTRSMAAKLPERVRTINESACKTHDGPRERELESASGNQKPCAGPNAWRPTSGESRGSYVSRCQTGRGRLRELA